MIRVSVKLDVQRLKRDFKGMERKAEKALARAGNRAIDATATAAAREISSATKIPVRTVRSKLIVRHMSASRLIAEIEAMAYTPNLKQFRPTQNARGVAASAWERRKTYKGAFINPRTRSVVARTSARRFPLKGLRGPSLRRTFMQRRILAKLESVALQTWRKRLDHEVARLLKGAS